jgi:hypothetical protein
MSDHRQSLDGFPLDLIKAAMIPTVIRPDCVRLSSDQNRALSSASP